MKQVLLRLVAALLGFAIGFVTAGVWRLQSAPSNPAGGGLPVLAGELPADSDLRQRVEQARRRGERHLFISSITCGMGVTDLAYALNNFSLVIARPVAQRTYANDWGLETWYRFQVIETLSARPPVRYEWETSESPLPAGMLPVGENEFLLHITGGTLVISDVIVSQRDMGFPNYSLEQTYLLFLNLDAERHVAHVPWTGDAVGIFAVREDGSFAATDNESYDLKEQLQRRFGNSLARLRQHLRR